MTKLIDTVLLSIKTHGALSVFLGGVIEEIVVPIPSPLISMGAGYFLIEPNLPLAKAPVKILFIVSFPFALGASLGSLFAYGIAFIGGKSLITRFGKFLDLSWDQIEKVEKRFIQGKKDEFLIFISRAIPVIPISLVSATCGFLRIPCHKFISFTFLGVIIRSFILSFLGWQVGELYHNLASGIDLVENIVTVILLVIMGVLLGFLYLKREKILSCD